MIQTGRRETDPVPVVRQTRSFPLRAVTTLKPGRFMPIAAYNLLREDSSQGSVPFAVEMRETHELLINRTHLRVSAWFVPHLANQRFEKNPTFFHKSYQGVIPMDGKAVIPFIETAPYGTVGANQVYKALGLFAGAAVQVNTSYLEAYNQIWNHVAINRSKDLTKRAASNGQLAPAFWGENNMSEIVPDFDDGLIAGETPLTVVEGRLQVSGIGFNNANGPTGVTSARETGGTSTSYASGYLTGAQSNGVSSNVVVRSTPLVGGVAGTNYPSIYAEMAANGIKVSLANLEQAKQLVGWAKLREQYEGYTDEWIIDTLMQGYHIEDQEFTVPILLDQTMVDFKQGLRYASDAANLNEKATNGVATGSVNVSVPANTYGGVIMIIAEVIPEQLYERQPDPWFTAKSVSDLPNYMQDVLNPMPVVEVKNGDVDASHATPTALFGWARRNWRWLKWPMRVGGDLFVHTASSATDEARRTIWPTDVANPKLSEEFYVSTTLGVQPFMDTTRDQFTVALNGQITVTGLTMIGMVHESEANYDKVRAKVPPLVRPA